MKTKILSIKTIGSYLAVFFISLTPFRPPNVEPVMVVLMPLAKKSGKILSFVFGFASIALVDLAEGRAGIWTPVTASTYGLVGLGAHFLLTNKNNTRLTYFKLSIIGTLFYDAVTGLGMGPLLFKQSFWQAFYGQMPFTVMHLLGNTLFAVSLSPVIFRWLAKENLAEVTSPKLAKI